MCRLVGGTENRFQSSDLQDAQNPDLQEAPKTRLKGSDTSPDLKEAPETRLTGSLKNRLTGNPKNPDLQRLQNQTYRRSQ